MWGEQIRPVPKDNPCSIFLVVDLVFFFDGVGGGQ